MSWTRCKDELPEKNGYYLVVFREETIDPFIGQCIFWDGAWGYGAEFTVTHWMEFPSLPDKEDEDEQDV